MTRKLYVLVGMIASGKSTWAREKADEGAVVVCHDDLTQMLHGRYRYEADMRICYRQMEEEIADAALLWGRDVVIDRTHLTRESRKRWIDFGRNLNRIHRWRGRREPFVEVIAVAFPRKIAYVHAKRRYESDSRGRSFHEWRQVAGHNQDQADAEPLSDAEGFDRIIRDEIIRVEGQDK